MTEKFAFNDLFNINFDKKFYISIIMKTRKLNLEDFEGMEISKNQIKNIIGGLPPSDGGILYDSGGNPIPQTGSGDPDPIPTTSNGDPVFKL